MKFVEGEQETAFTNLFYEQFHDASASGANSRAGVAFATVQKLGSTNGVARYRLVGSYRFNAAHSPDPLPAAGGTEATRYASLHRERNRSMGDDIKAGKANGLGDVYNRPAETFVIRRPDRAIWIHLATDNASGNMAVVETKAFVATAQLLPADALKKAIDAQGKAVVHVDFATDDTTILPDSQPQIEAIAALLKQSPTLRLAINGYTDETGSAAHNRTRSEGRAASMRQSLVTAGINAARLTSRGFGSDDAVAGNDSEVGKAQNRRVELVKL